MSSDLSQQHYLAALREPGRADGLMRDALQALLQWQAKVPVPALPDFDDTLLRQELALFPEWFVQHEFGVIWTDPQQKIWQRVCDHLVASALAQPRVAVHGSPHELMVNASHSMHGVQNLLNGPVTYDLACLLRDPFISWDEAQELDWAVRWWQQARRARLSLGDGFEADFGEFWRALEWMGLQRQLKLMGIGCRMKHRDGKASCSEELPCFFQYATRVALRYVPLKPLLALLEPLSGQRVHSGFTF